MTRLLVLMISLSLSVIIAQEECSVQIIHNSASPMVDVYLLTITEDGVADTTLAVEDFMYRDATGVISLPTVFSVGIAPADGDLIAVFPFELMEGGEYRVVANGLIGNTDTPFDLLATESSFSVSDSSMVGLQIFHGSTDAPSVDIYANGSMLISDFAYGEFSEFIEVPEDNYEIEIAPSGGEVMQSFTAPYGDQSQAGNTAFIFASGLLSGEDPGFTLISVYSDGHTIDLNSDEGSCFGDCPDIELFDNEDMMPDEMCTIISSWDGNSCTDDCDEEMLSYIVACLDCLANDNCNQLFGDCGDYDNQYDCETADSCNWIDSECIDNFSASCMGSDDCDESSFCNMDFPEANCEPCLYASSSDDCYDLGLPCSEDDGAGVEQCLNECFGEEYNPDLCSEGDSGDGPPECLMDCTDIELVDSLIDSDQFDEACTIITSLADDSCHDDCEGEEAIFVDFLISSCEECLSSGNCEDVFSDDSDCYDLDQADCESADSCAWNDDDMACEDFDSGGDCIMDCPDVSTLFGDIAGTEYCTVIAGWEGDACLDDCSSDEMMNMAMVMALCSSCLDEGNCDDMFDGDDCSDYDNSYDCEYNGCHWDADYMECGDAGDDGPPECLVDCSGVDDVDEVCSSESATEEECAAAYCSFIESNYNATEGSCWDDCEDQYNPQIDGSFEECGLDLSNGADIPIEFGISAVYPNPFNPSTSITYNVSDFSRVDIDVYDMSGKLVDTLVNEYRNPGVYSVTWEASDFSSGVYLIKMTSGSLVQAQKVLLIK